jgi:endogenous inhibitor of DNA gyrase (YacG/DUF329 family)
MAKRAKKCANCGRVLRQAATGRPRKFCSGACKQVAYIERIREAAEQSGREAGREQAISEMRGRRLLA